MADAKFHALSAVGAQSRLRTFLENAFVRFTLCVFVLVVSSQKSVRWRIQST